MIIPFAVCLALLAQGYQLQYAISKSQPVLKFRFHHSTAVTALQNSEKLKTDPFSDTTKGGK